MLHRQWSIRQHSILTTIDQPFTYRVSFVVTPYVVSLHEHRITYRSSVTFPGPCSSIYSVYRDSFFLFHS